MLRAPGAAGAVFVCLVLLLVGGWLLAASGGVPTGCDVGSLRERAVPADLVPVFAEAAQAYGLGAEAPAILAALTKVESGFGRNMGPSSAGAIGWTQFMPTTWQRYGVDADGDGTRDPMSAADAIYSAANYLRHLGAPRDWRRALFGYNHADSYVDEVLGEARRLAAGARVDEPMCAAGMESADGADRLIGGG